MGALSYADDIILLCPIIRGLNRRLKMCCFLPIIIILLLKCKKTSCIKFGSKTHDYEHFTLDGNNI